LDSDADGRVQVIQDPEGCAENLDQLVASLTREQKQQMKTLRDRFQGAIRYLRTGRL